MQVRHLRRVVGVLFLAVLLGAAWLLVGVRRPVPKVEVDETRASAGELPAKSEEEAGCFDDFVLDWAGDRLASRRACKRVDGSSSFDGVDLRLSDDAGVEEMTLKADAGVLPAEQGDVIHLTGNVRVATPDGMTLETEALTLLKAEERIRSDVPVRFAQQDLTGVAGRLDHDWKARVTTLELDPVVTIEGERTDGRRIVLEAVKLVRSDDLVHLEGAAEIDFADGRIQGDVVDVALGAAGEQVERIDAKGNARTITTTAPAGVAGGEAVTRTLSGQEIAHEFAEKSRLRAVRAGGGARLEGAGTSATGAAVAELLVGRSLDLGFDPASGAMLRSLDAIGEAGAPAQFRRAEGTLVREVHGTEIHLQVAPGGRLDRLVAKGGARVSDTGGPLERTLTGDDAEIGFASEGDHLDDLAFTGAPARLREAPGPGAAPGVAARTIVARKGRIAFDSAGLPVDGSLEGDVEMSDGTGTAKADRARLDTGPRRTILEGHASIEREGRVSHGDEIVRDHEASTLVVTGSQHTILRDSQGLPGMEGLEGGDAPIYISSDRLLVDEPRKTAEYTGGRPSLQRGDTRLLADRLLVDEGAGTFRAEGGVESRLRLARAGTAPEPGALFDPSRIVDGHSDVLTWARAEKLVTYTGDVKLEQEGAVIEADEVDVHLAEAGGRVERLVASGNAVFTSPEREAEGSLLEYRSSDGRVRIESGRRPARAKDAQGTVTGGILEMDSAGIRVVAAPSGRTRGSSTLADQRSGAPKGPGASAAPEDGP